MIDRDIVIAAYRLLLGRMPENETVIGEKQQAASEVGMLLDMMASAEFEARSGFTPAPDRWVLVEHELSFRIWINLADLGVSRPILLNRYESPGAAFVGRHLAPGDHFVDIGSNVGFYALLAARLVGPDGRVTGFEAHAELCAAATKSVAENGFANCVVHNVALGEQPGSADLVYAPGSSNWGGAFLSFDGTRLPGHASRPVEVMPLADYLADRPASLIKIDVEGAEHLVLRGALELLRAQRPLILSELHAGQLRRVSGVTPVEYVEMMASAGYLCHRLANGGDLGPTITGHEPLELLDVVFVPADA